MMKTIKIFGVLCVLGVMSSCEYNVIKPDTGAPVDPDEPISFAEEVAPIWTTQQCTNCHDGSVFSLTPDGAYQSLVSRGLYDLEVPENSRILTFPATGHGGGYVSNQSEIIRVWIEQGAQNN